MRAGSVFSSARGPFPESPGSSTVHVGQPFPAVRSSEARRPLNRGGQTYGVTRARKPKTSHDPLATRALPQPNNPGHHRRNYQNRPQDVLVLPQPRFRGPQPAAKVKRCRVLRDFPDRLNDSLELSRRGRLGRSLTRNLARRGRDRDGNWDRHRGSFPGRRLDHLGRHGDRCGDRLPPARRFQPFFLFVQFSQGGSQTLWRNHRGRGGGGTGRRTTTGST
jgi:hypothetical protein